MVHGKGDRGRCALGSSVCVGLLVVLGLGVSDEARGDTATREPVRLSYRSEGLCPSAETFFAYVRARTDKIRPATASERARTLEVAVEEGATESRGSLAVVGDDGAASSSRTVRATTCQDVVTALALVAALAIDPEARTAPLEPPTDAAPPPPRAAPTDAGVEAAKAPDAAPAHEPPRVAREPHVRTPTELRGSIGVGAEGSSLLALRPALAVSLGLDVVRDALVSPSFTLRLTRTFEGTSRVAAGAALVTFSSAALEPCPVRVALGALTVLPCARLAFGFVEAEGSGMTSPASALRGWADVGAHARASFRAVGPIFVEAHAGARFPLFRDRYFVDEGTALYEVPVAIAAFGGDLRVAFP